MSEMWDFLLSRGLTEQTLQVVTSINGYRMDVLEDILYVHTGYRSMDQMIEAGE